MSKRSNTDEEGKPSKKPKPVGGNRCVLYGCSNTIHDGFAIHELPKEGSIRRAWVKFIQLKLKGFDARERVHVHVCSGHFERDQYDSSQVLKFKYGFRKITPRLLPNAIPRRQQAVQPFADHWFLKPTTTTSSTSTMSSTMISPTVSSPMISSTTTSTPTTSTLTATTCLSSTRTRTVHSTKIAVSSLDSLKKRVGKQGGHAHNQPITFADASTCTSPTMPTTSGNRRRVSVLSLKKMIDKHFQKRPKTRTCGIQVKPVKPVKPVKSLQKEKGVQITLSSSLEKAERQVSMRTSATQTEDIGAEQETFDEPEDEHEEPEEPDDKRKDPDYEPENELEDEANEEVENMKIPSDVIDQPKYIVFEDQLLELFKKCRHCHLPCSSVVHHPPTFGSRVKVISTCDECDGKFEWSSQPSVGNLYAGNILLSSAILFAGASPTKVLKIHKYMNLKSISTTTFNEHQSRYLQPAIVKEYRRTQAETFDEIRASEAGLILGGDGRSDSPGHSAKYGSYTMMDLKSNKVIDVQLVQCTEVKNSNAMELEGLRRGLRILDEAGVIVQGIVTDRHMQIAKFLRETYQQIDHRYDVWHIAKGLKKKLKALAKMKDCGLVQDWLRALVNHVYWTASSTPDGDKDVMKAKYKRAMNHIRNLHTDENPEYTACEHGDDYPEREWLQSGTKVYEKLREEWLRTRLVNGIGMMSPHAQTSKVESFHNILLHFCPKLLVYSYQGMKCRLYLAVLHWNENCDRAQAVDAEGNPVYRLKYPRSKEGGHTVERVLTAGTCGYVKALMRVVVELVENREQLRDNMEELQPQPARSASHHHPDNGEAVQAFEQHHRFGDRN